MDLIELNEAFPAQVLACTREWGFGGVTPGFGSWPRRREYRRDEPPVSPTTHRQATR
jgi:acetyl-CoA acetyltransferase